MSDEGKRRDELARAVFAKDLEENPIWLEAKVGTLDGLSAAWESTSPEQTAEREHIWQMRQAAKNVFRHIESVVETGKLAEMQLEKLNERRDAANSRRTDPTGAPLN